MKSILVSALFTGGFRGCVVVFVKVCVLSLIVGSSTILSMFVNTVFLP